MSIFSRWFRRFRNRRIRNEELDYMDEQEYSQLGNERVVEDIDSIKKHVVSLCKQMAQISKELEEVRREYDKVTSYLCDVQIVKNLTGDKKKQLEEAATQVTKLIKARNDCLNAERKISDEVFNQMEETEAEVPDVIRRMKVNESDLEKVKHDLNYLVGEKVECSVLRHEREEEVAHLRRLSIALLFAFGGLAILVTLLSMTLEWGTFPLFIVALLATLCAAYVVLRIQECKKDIKQCDLNQNYIISLENRVKIKYVNVKNAVDYTCNRFHVHNSRELTFNYEQYIEICKEREKFKQVNEDLEYFKNRLIRILHSLDLYDAKIWLNYANAIIDKNEMVELKHGLFTRRKLLRKRIDYNQNAISEMKHDVNLYLDKLGKQAAQIKAIINKVEEIKV